MISIGGSRGAASRLPLLCCRAPPLAQSLNGNGAIPLSRSARHHVGIARFARRQHRDGSTRIAAVLQLLVAAVSLDGGSTLPTVAFIRRLERVPIAPTSHLISCERSYSGGDGSIDAAILHRLPRQWSDVAFASAWLHLEHERSTIASYFETSDDSARKPRVFTHSRSEKEVSYLSSPVESTAIPFRFN